MNPLVKRLASLRRKVRLLDAWQGVCALIALIVGVGLTVGLLDYAVHLASVFRAALLVSLLIGSGVVAYWYLARPFGRSCDDLSLALRVEEVYPELNDSLASTVQFLKQSPEDESRVGGSASMRERTVKETMEKAAACDFGRILDRRAAVLFGAAACCVLLAAGAVVSMNRAYAGIAFWRFVEPFGQHTWTRIAVLRQAPIDMQEAKEEKWEPLSADPKVKDRIAIGRPYRLEVHIEGQIPKSAKIEVEGQLIRSEKIIDLLNLNNPENVPELKRKSNADRQSVRFVHMVDMTGQYQKFKFRILANDGSFPPRFGAWHEVEVVPPPKLIDLDGQPSPQIALYPPLYSDLPSPIKLVAGTRHLEVIAGTRVVLRAKADRDLAQAWIEYLPEQEMIAPASKIAALLGHTNPLHALAQVVGAPVPWAPIPAVLDNGGSELAVSFTPMVSGRYVLHLRDHDRLEYHEASDLRVQLDPAPGVKLVQPGSSVTAHPTANIAFKFRVTDELFAVRSVFVEYRLKKPDGTLIGERKRTVLYDATNKEKIDGSNYAKLLPYLLAEAARSALKGPDLRLRYKQMDFEVVWPLRNEFNDGDIVVIEVCADDFCDIYSTREPGRSHAIELRIVAAHQIVNEAGRDLADIQQQLKNLEQMEKKALGTTKETRTKDKFERADTEKFIDDDEQVQRRIQDIVGRAPDEGLRRDLAKIRQQLKDNQLTDTQAYRDAGKIKGVLDSIAQQELPQIEPKLADIRNELTQNEKNSPKTQKKLDETAQLQKSVLRGLQELNKELDPSARMQEHQEKLRDLLEKQNALRKELEDLNAKRASDDKKNPEFKKEIDQNFRDDVKRKAEEQQGLFKQMEKLLEEMKAAKVNREQSGDRDNAKKLGDAIKIAEPEQPKAKPMPPEPKNDEAKKPLTTKMKDVANELKELKPNQKETPQQTLDQQKDIAKDLERALKALEGRDSDVTKQEIQKRKDAEKKIDELAKDLKKLQDETKKVNQIEDMEERLKRKEELAKKHAKLQEEMQDLRRQLARLEEHRPENDLNDAANNIEKAKNQLQQGGDPQDAQKKAQEDLKRAKQELQQAEEELARELLVKIADQLEGLKKRQVALVDRSENLHAKVMKKKSWLDATLDTLEGNLDTQKGIADETDSFKEKLKEAKVFHSILERAKDSMDKAGEAMTNRRDTGKERRYIEKGEGELMDAMEIADEVDAQNKTITHQKQAARRLEILLDSIKQELAKKKKKPRDDVAKNEDPDKNPEEKKSGIQPADGIPPMAQLKALKAEQLDLNQRTENFAKQHPDTTKLNDQQMAELRELEQEQERLQSLFQQLVTPPEGKEGDQP